MAEDAAVRSLVERDRVAEVIKTLFVATDARGWAREAMTDTGRA